MKHSHRRQKAGFTLIELLVVMSIMAVLIAITVSIFGSAVNAAKTNATKATIKKIDGLLKERLESFVRAMETKKPSELIALAPPEFQSSNPPLALILGRKTSFQLNFPQTNLEAFGTASSSSDKTDSAEALYFMLTKMEIFGSAPVGEDQFSASEVMDTDGDERLEFVDAWEQPLRFYRWPTRLIRPDNGAAQPFPLDLRAAKLLYGSLPSEITDVSIIPLTPLAVDADDPKGLIDAAVTANLFDAADFETIYKYHTLDTYSAPLIVSAGEDGNLGLFEPNDTDNFGNLAQPINIANLNDLFDNISNLKLRAGGN